MNWAQQELGGWVVRSGLEAQQITVRAVAEAAAQE